MMSHDWQNRLSEYLDGELTQAERVELEAHLAGCGACRDTLGQLRDVVAAAHALEDRAPAADLWSGVAQRIGAGGAVQSDVVALDQHRKRRRVRITLSIPQLAAAGIALMLVSAASVYLLSSRPAELQPPQVATATREATAEAVLVGFDIAEYDAAVAELERVLSEARERLDPGTVAILEQSLATIDRAIAEAHQALRDDPANRYLSTHLAATMKRKIQLLQRATTIANAAS
jgi:hypothetical protein